MQRTADILHGSGFRRANVRFIPAFGLLLLLVLLAGIAVADDGDNWERDYSFSDSLTPERRANLTGEVVPVDIDKEIAERLRVLESTKDLPSRFDWRDQGIVTSVKDQGTCGSCWAFCAVAQIEAHFSLYYHHNLDLSEQQAIFCNDDGSDCGGGWASSVYEVAESNGLNRENAEPYARTSTGVCTQTDYLSFGFVSDWYYVNNQVEQIKLALLDGPVATSMDADPPLEDYSTGCYDVAGGPYTNHCVLIVGWDDKECGGNGAWIVKNSWGTDFGESGYFSIEYGASLIGSFTRQIEIDLPPVEIDFREPYSNVSLIAGQPVDITWETSGAACSTVDIWVSYDGEPFTERIAEAIPNTGSFSWLVVNHATENLIFCITADGDTRQGYALTESPRKIIGYRTRYVSDSGSDTAPYDTPETAAHSLADAVYACTGFDSVMVLAGEYSEGFTINHTVRIFGGWNADFSVRDPEGTPTVIRNVSTPMSFSADGGDYAGVDGITFRDCTGSLYAAPAMGRHAGAIRVYGGSPTIANCIFEDCSGDPTGGFGSGGAIQSFIGNPVIEDCVFTGNKADQGGALALFDNISVILRRNTFINNACDDSLSSNNYGAAIYVEGGPLIGEDLAFIDNGAAYTGGAIRAVDADLQLTDVEFSGNRGYYDGGALSLDGGAISLINCDFLANTSGSHGGGALAGDGTLCDLENCLMAGNYSSGMGGAISVQNYPYAALRNCVIQGNSSGLMFGGVFCTGDSLLVRNTIISENTGGGIGGSASATDIDYNDIWGNVGGDMISLTGGINDISQDPLFVDTAGGDFALALHSPCVDTGDPDPACNDSDGSRADRGVYGGPSGAPTAPAMITGLTAVATEAPDFRLNWDASADPDIAQYVVYACPLEGFLPSAGAMVALVSQPDTEYEAALDPLMHYTVAAVDTDGRMGGLAAAVALPTGGGAVSDAPRVLAINAVIPNPFNPSTMIEFDLPSRGRVVLKVYDMRGHEVRSLIDDVLESGSHQAHWNGRDNTGAKQAAGVYLMRLSAKGRHEVAKVVMAK